MFYNNIILFFITCFLFFKFFFSKPIDNSYAKVYNEFTKCNTCLLLEGDEKMEGALNNLTLMLASVTLVLLGIIAIRIWDR